VKKTAVYLIILLWALYTPTLAEETSTPQKLRVVTELANIRQRPDIGSEVIRQVPQGTILLAEGKEGDWYLIRLETQKGEVITGYIHESLVLKTELPQEEKEVEKQELEEPQPEVKKKEEEKEPVAQELPLETIPEIPGRPQFIISASGGRTYFVTGDPNRGANGFVQFLKEDLSLKGNAKPDAVHLDYIFGGEASFELFPQLYLGIGVTHFQGKKKSEMEFTKDTIAVNLVTQPEIKATPIRAFLTFYPLPSVYLKGGVEYYCASCSYFYSIQEGSYWKKWQGRTTARGLGLLAGLGTQWNLSSNLAIFIETDIRYARIQGFKGKDVSSDSLGSEYTEEGTLYYYRAVITQDKSFPQLFILKKPPAEAWIQDPRQAVVDFSGLALRLGIRLTL